MYSLVLGNKIAKDSQVQCVLDDWKQCIKWMCKNVVWLTKLLSGSNTAMVKSKSKYSRNSLTNPVTRQPKKLMIKCAQNNNYLLEDV